MSDLELLIYGTNAKGHKVSESQHLIGIAAHNIGNAIADYKRTHDCIHIRVDIAYPDPEFVKAEEALVSFLEENGIRDTKVQAKALAHKLMKEFVIKLPETENE